MKVITDVIIQDGLVDTILQCLGINIADVDVTSALGITLIITACVVALAIVFFIVKSLVSLCRGGKY